MSEKYDGVRAYWNGEDFTSRHGRTIKTPSSFAKGMPRGQYLDGELWMGRKSFEQMTRLVNAKKSKVEKMSEEWKGVKYMVFDLPNSQESVERRMEMMKSVRLPNHAKMVEKIECKGDEHLEEYLTAIVEGGGEGVMAQRPGSKYRVGRTGDIVKIKVRR